MLKIAGVILCIAGSAGYGMLKIAGWNKAARELEQWILLFENMRSRICYRRDIIAEVFCSMDEEIYGIGGKYVAAVGHDLKKDRAKELMQVWQEKMAQWKQLSSLSKEVKKNILAFPEYVGEQDCEQQLQRLDFYLRRLCTEKEKLEKEMDSKKRPVMAISLAGGITVSLLLI